MQIAAGIPVDIMPGEADPANFALPQQVSAKLIMFWFVRFIYVDSSY